MVFVRKGYSCENGLHGYLSLTYAIAHCPNNTNHKAAHIRALKKVVHGLATGVHTDVFTITMVCIALQEGFGAWCCQAPFRNDSLLKLSP